MVIGSIHAAPKSVAVLKQQSKPTEGGGLEAFQYVLYHRRQYVSGTTRSLTFFNATGDDDVTNMEAAQQLPDPQFFEIWGVHFFVLQPVTSTAEGITGAWDNVNLLVKTGGVAGSTSVPVFTLRIGAKPYGAYPLLVAHDLGGPTGFGVALDAVAAGGTPSSTQYANNGVLGYGLNFRGSLTIPPKQKFNVQVNWASALTLAGGNTDVVFALSGVIHRDIK